MDLKEVSLTLLRGQIIGIFSSMNGGKTKYLIEELERAPFNNMNAIAYNHERNSRESHCIMANGTLKYPAVNVGSIGQMRKDLEMRIGELNRFVSRRPRGKPAPNTIVEIDGIQHYKFLPLGVVGIDEVNLFCLSHLEKDEFEDFMLWSKQEKLVLYVSGLIRDFRRMDFGKFHELLPTVDIQRDPKPACMAIRDNYRKCVNTANYTQRLWHKSFAEEQGMTQLLQENGHFDFTTKSLQPIVGEYLPAPFFDLTLRIEEEENNKVVYLPVCTDCSKVPYRVETERLYDAIRRGEDPRGMLENQLLTQKILSFFTHPNEPQPWAIEVEEGVYRPSRG